MAMLFTPQSGELGDSGSQAINLEKETDPRTSKGSPSSRSSAGFNDSITYEYLTFETELPVPHLGHSNTTDRPAPLQPNLKKFTSPFLWSKGRKDVILYISCIATMLTSYTAGSLAPASMQMAAEWDVSQVAILVGITTFCLGFGIAPMVLAPFSEIQGRYPVFAGAGVLYVVCQIATSITTSYPGMIVARFWVGCGSSVFATMVGGVVTDMYHAGERNTPMALYSGAVLVGTGLGPAISGALTQHLGWRWVFYFQIITCTVMVASVIMFFQETRGSVLLSKKAKVLNKWYDALEEAGYVGLEIKSGLLFEEKTVIARLRWKVESDEERESISKMIGISLWRPIHLLMTEPVVASFSVFVSFAWGVLYLTFGSIPLVFSTNHGFTVEQSGLVFLSMSIGSVLATALAIYQERYSSFFFSRWEAKATAGGKKNTEHRLYFCCFESMFLPIGLFWFGWTQFSSILWIVPTLAVGCATMGIFSMYLATFNYLADTYHRYASSALAAQSFCRNLIGGIFPLITTGMYHKLTFQGASSLLGGIAVVLTIVPWVLVLYGPYIRARSKFASEIM